MSSGDRTDTVVTIPVGDDIVLAQSLAASLAEEGIEAELVLSRDPYVGLEHTSPHRLMIHQGDLEMARPLIAGHFEDAAIGTPSPARQRGLRDVAAAVLLVAVAGGPVIGILMVIRELLGM